MSTLILSGAHRDVISQLAKGPKQDGDIASKAARDDLAHWSAIDRVDGWNFLTKEGVQLAVFCNFLVP